MKARMLRSKTTLVALLVILTPICSQVFSQSAPAAAGADDAPFKIEIEQNRSAEAGHDAVVVIRIRSGLDRITGFSFLLAFDTANMALRQVEPGGFVTGHGWEEFSVEPITPAPGDTIAPVNLLRITAAVGQGVPPDTLQKSSSGLVRLVFYFDNKVAVACKNFPVRFFWRTCEDNVVLAGTEKTLYYVREVHDLKSAWSRSADTTDDCLAQAPKGPETPRCCLGDAIPSARRGVVFINGGIIGYCTEFSHVLGDIDLNGLPDQETDVAALARFLVHGCLCGYQTDSLQFVLNSVKRSPADSIALSISSLVYANRIVSGDAVPIPPRVKDNLPLTIKISGDSLIISYESQLLLGAIMLTFETDSGKTWPISSEWFLGHQIAAGQYGGRLCVIFYDIGRKNLPQGDITLTYDAFPGLKRLISAKAVDYFGQPVMVTLTDH